MPEQAMKTIKQQVKFLLGLVVIMVGAVSQSQTTAAGSTSQYAVSPTGAVIYRIPIQVPPGLAGMQLKLELTKAKVPTVSCAWGCV